MKYLSTFIVAIALSISAFSQAKLPEVQIQNIDFETFNTLNIKNDGKPIIISFWATWCAPCKAELNAIADEWPDWEETGVKIYIVSIDNSRSVNSVQPYVYGQDWPFITLLDVNSEFRRAMNVNNVPHAFLLNGKGEIVWQHNGYNPGDEEELLELVHKLNAGEEI
ncbi:TlpA family protein disulfide reductase [bacterium SCSIO 12643]|nr:TlpA family protein disulfide reductase [bacterium SCSIO 12643]